MCPRLSRLVALLAAVVPAFSIGLSPVCGESPVPAPLAASGAAIAPRDAAFFSATLRLREQWQRIESSNAYASIMKLPAVRRALDSLEEQRTMPGSPLSMVETFMSLPENIEARELLADMIATDTFVYGEPSCISFLQLVKKLQRAQQAAALLNARGFGGGFMLEEELELFDDSDEPEARAGRLRVRPVRLRADDGDADEGDDVAVLEEEEDFDDDDAADDGGPGLMLDEFDPEQVQKRLLAQTLVDNLDLLVVPDVVWGFRTAKADTAKAQLVRLEALGRLLVQMNPDFEKAIERRSVAGGEFLVVTLSGAQVPWQELQDELAGDLGDITGLDKVFERLKSLAVVVALGQIGDRVILSVGGSLDHLAKLALPAGVRPGLLTTKPFEPLRKHADKPLTGISYISGEMAAALATTADDLAATGETLAAAAEAGDVSEEALEETRQWLADGATNLATRLPTPGPWLAYAFFSDEGYEGYAWNWAGNRAFDGTKRLDLLDHAGGAPLAVAALRLKDDPRFFDDVGAFISRGLDLLRKYGLPGFDDADFDELGRVDEALAPLATRLAETIRGKIVPAIGAGQVGFVLDAKAKVNRPHRDLPSSAEPLPLVEPALALPLADPKLFREGLSDIFALSDELVAAVRRINPQAVRPGYRVPDPEKDKVEAGTVWTFPLPNAGLDDQVRPTIGVGETAAVFSLVPAQAVRMLGASRLETGSGPAEFEEPLACAAALDFAGVVDAVRPWVLYAVRYGCALQREGQLGPDEDLAADDETEQAKEALEVAGAVLEAAKCFRSAVAASTVKDDALVTHWRNVIRDLPAKP
jgi:hypothetical protein